MSAWAVIRSELQRAAEHVEKAAELAAQASAEVPMERDVSRGNFDPRKGRELAVKFASSLYYSANDLRSKGERIGVDG